MLIASVCGLGSALTFRSESKGTSLMKWRTRLKDVLFGVLIPLLVGVWMYEHRFKTPPAWSRDIYPYVFWSLLAVVAVLLIVYLVGAVRRR